MGNRIYDYQYDQLDKDIAEYLTLLVEQLSTRDAMEALGYSSNSYSSLRSLLDVYEVEIPVRLNQFKTLGVDNGPEYAIARKVSLRAAHRATVAIERAVVFGDTHGVNTDPKAYAVMLSVIRDIQPEFIFINGDFVDFEAISRFSKDPNVELQLQEELDNANQMLDALMEAAPNAKITYVEGNHEVRLREYLRKFGKSLVGIKPYRGEQPIMSVPSLLLLKERGIKYVEQVGKSAYTKYGEITIGHFDKYSSIPGAVAKWFMEHRNESVIQGHTHKCAQLFRRFPDGREITCIEGGHLMEPDPDYVTDPDWCQGFVVITKRTKTDRFHTDLIRIIDHECLVGDVLYSG